MVVTRKNLSWSERGLLADKASGVVMKGEDFVSQIRAILSTLFPISSLRDDVKSDD